ncbi:hypothetical protein TWF569_004273 [Orbilia oligospora]|uniref:Uncharacterized protein n=1 Tax=Orbilia oligospora TaxID=2813651 RepID=A0A7C8NR34_ORBOL|nr:hypothetical protein TWF706_006754 [Orbilia oligospora]KAF3099446.1 hypothetical protein TWF102_005427 [Orbilia oligospora]KAF3112500.1 hypothetical protein TWF103_002755 [Orbilia oligospora]KAF3119245.1 hypothetical protein TWF569_004273 [Orbilia oligospora]KAF3129996.1 hypothetical protein TWF594_010571 [Orbilia oligospora]
MVHSSIIPTWVVISTLHLLSPVSAVRIPFYMVVKAAYHSSVPPHGILTTVPYLVVPKITKPDPITGRKSKYFFLKTLTELDTPTINESKFWYDTVSRAIYSETTVEVQNTGDSNQSESSPSIEEDFPMEGAVGGLVQGISSLNLVALEGGDAQAPPPILEIDPDTHTEMWELFGSMSVPSGPLKAADLEVTSSLNNFVAQAYTGNKKLVFQLVDGQAGQTDGQLWLWRCIFGLEATLPLGPSIMSQFPDMDPVATAEFFKGIHHVLLVKPKYEDQVAQKPKSWDPLAFDGMNCFRIDPWKNVLAVSANEMESNLQGIKQGTYDYESRSVQIINVGGLFPELQEEEPFLSPSEEGSPEEGSGEWTQQLQVPNKPFGSQNSVYSEHMKSP